MSSIARSTAAREDIVDVFTVWSDFVDDQSDLFFIDTITDAGTALVNDARKGIMTLTPSDGTVADNDEVYLASANEVFLFVDGKPIHGKCLLQFTETTAGVYNAFFGFANAVAANTLVDDGGGMRTSGSIAAIVKVDGETVWRAVTRNGSTVTNTQSTTTAGGSAYQLLEIFVEDFSSTQCQVTFKVDGNFLLDANNNPIVHRVLYASATEMQVAAGAKLGAATNNDVLNLDYIYAQQKR